MKVILSRKGFDSGCGGYPSPIIPDGRLISLPIPSDDKAKYSDLQFDKNQTYFDLMGELKSKIRYRKKWHELKKNNECHLDPDLYKNILQRNKDWKPCFGQINQSQSHLVNEGVKKNDLFLFFGWFKKTILKNGKFQFDISAPDLHIIFGYLQIGDIIQINNNTKIPNWMKNHPHANNEDYKKIITNITWILTSNATALVN
ncbi:MAG: hypothetical protein Q8N21_01925 [bacterium]|nr:hypothetical protein [bacterium]